MLGMDRDAVVKVNGRRNAEPGGNRFMKMRSVLLAAVMAWAAVAWAVEPAGPVRVKVVHRGQHGSCCGRASPTSFTAGAAADPRHSWPAAAEIPFAPGASAPTLGQLDEAEREGLTVALGRWLGHKDHGFHYSDARAVPRQGEDVRRAVLKIRTIRRCCWSLGNEMEQGNDTPQLWRAIEDLAKMVHQIDPKHPTMTVVAEIGGNKVRNIHKYCPDIDVIGINSYGGGVSLAERYRKAGGTKPFIITEFGRRGRGRSARTPSAPRRSRPALRRPLLPPDLREVGVARGSLPGGLRLHLGMEERGHGHLVRHALPDDSRLAAVDTMQELWTVASRRILARRSSDLP